MPVWSKANGPSNLSSRQPRSARISGGTTSAGRISESSSAVRVIAAKPLPSAQAGSGASGASRQTAYSPGRRMRVSEGRGEETRDERPETRDQG